MQTIWTTSQHDLCFFTYKMHNKQKITRHQTVQEGNEVDQVLIDYMGYILMGLLFWFKKWKMITSGVIWLILSCLTTLFVLISIVIFRFGPDIWRVYECETIITRKEVEHPKLTLELMIMLYQDSLLYSFPLDKPKMIGVIGHSLCNLLSCEEFAQSTSRLINEYTDLWNIQQTKYHKTSNTSKNTHTKHEEQIQLTSSTIMKQALNL